MNTERLIQIVLSELNTENLKIQHDLELSINRIDNIDTKVYEIKTALRELAINELSIMKFTMLMNNNEINNNTNGK